MAIRCALLVVSTAKDPVSEEAVDAIRGFLQQALPALYFVQESRAGSDRNLIEEILRGWCDEEEMDLVLTVGGTLPAPGLSGEQATPEATATVIEQPLPGLPEAMRAYAVEEIVEAALDRGVAGIRARTLIVNLPGSEALARLFIEAIAELLGPVVARLRPDAEPVGDEAEAESQPRRSSGLNAEDFAAFLAARRAQQSDAE